MPQAEKRPSASALLTRARIQRPSSVCYARHKLTVLRMTNLILGLILSIAAAGRLVSANGIDPTGIYLNTFSGSFSGTEWFQITPGREEGVLLMTDIRGGGFAATVDANGSVAFDGGS